MIGPEFHVETKEREPRLHIAVQGEIDIQTAPQLERALAEPARGPVIVDLSNVEFIDSTGLRVLAMARTRIAEEGGRLIVRAADNSPVVRTMRLAGLASDFDLITDLDELAAQE